MALSIKTSEADELARQLVALTHETLTDAVTVALRERLARLREGQPAGTSARLHRLAAEYAAHPVTDPRPPDDLIGYDGVGLPG